MMKISLDEFGKPSKCKRHRRREGARGLKLFKLISSALLLALNYFLS